jgi:hypothetical protein
MGNVDKAFILAGIFSLGVLIAVSSCGDNEQVRELRPTKQALEATIESEQWRVTYYFDGMGERKDFNGLTFYFENDGGFIAFREKTKVNGIWSAFDAPNGQVKLNMEFHSEMPFEMLNDDWVVVESTDSRITLEDKTGSTGDRLTLEKV